MMMRSTAPIRSVPRQQARYCRISSSCKPQPICRQPVASSLLAKSSNEPAAATSEAPLISSTGASTSSSASPAADASIMMINSSSGGLGQAVADASIQQQSLPGSTAQQAGAGAPADASARATNGNRSSNTTNGSGSAGDTGVRDGEWILFTADELQQDQPPVLLSSASEGPRVSSTHNASSNLPGGSSTDSSNEPISTSPSSSIPDGASTSTSSDSTSLDAQACRAEPLQEPPAAQQPAQQQDVPPLPTHLTLSVGPAEEATDEGPFAADAAQQQVFVPPPLIDPDVDIANDPAYAIRLMDILDQIASSSSRSQSTTASQDFSQDSQAAEAAAMQQHQPRHRQQLRFMRQPAAFCTNCCTPLDPLRPAAACSTCGHFAADDQLLFNQGVSSTADMAAHTPPWLLLQQQKQGIAPGSALAAVKAGAWRRQQQHQQQQHQQQQEQPQPPTDAQQQQQQQGPQQDTSTDSSSSDAAVMQERAQAAELLQRARQELQAAGVLKLPKTLLAWEDQEQDGVEPAMHLHRGLLPPNHERPERLSVIEARLKADGLVDCCERLAPREASDAELLAVHTPGLIAAVTALSNANTPSDLNRVAAHLAPDALGNRYTNRAARTAAGTAAELARRLVLGQGDNGMALIRPLGQAAGVDTTEAGCYYNNVAVAVRAAQHAGARRVMVIDWDIHHCKGTEEIFAEDPNVVVVSLHRYGSSYYPGTGAATDIGVGRGRGRTINVAWSPPVVVDKRGRRVQVDAPPVSDGDYLTAWHMLVLPVLAEFRPDLILVSAGFDAVDKDPLGHYRVHPECFGHLTALLKPYGPVGLLLEGGYNLAATAACVEACMRVLLGERPMPLRGTRSAGVTGWSSVLRTLLVHQEHWQSLGLLNFLQLASTPPSGPGEWEEDEGFEVQGQEWEEGDEGEDEYELASDDEASAEQELREEEYEQALASAAKQQPAAAVTVPYEDAPAQLQQLLEAAQEDQDFMHQLLQLLQQRKAALASEAHSKQQQRAAAAAAEADQALAAAAAARAQARSKSGGSCSDSSSTGGSSSSVAASTPSSKGARDALSSWSAGGFLEDHEAIDSGSDDEVMANVPNSMSPLGSTDWGWQQLDEDAQDNLPWFEVAGVQEQLRKAEQDAAAAMAAAAAAAEAAMAAAAGSPELMPEVKEAIEEAAVAAVTAEATLAVAAEATKEAEEAAAAALAAAAAAVAAGGQAPVEAKSSDAAVAEAGQQAGSSGPPVSLESTPEQPSRQLEQQQQQPSEQDPQH